MELEKHLSFPVDKVIFVGSTAVGKMVMGNTSKTLIPVTLELGGKDAFIALIWMSLMLHK